MGMAIQITIPSRNQESLDVFSNQEIIQKARGFLLGRQIPGRCNGQAQNETADPGQATHLRPIGAAG